MGVTVPRFYDHQRGTTTQFLAYRVRDALTHRRPSVSYNLTRNCGLFTCRASLFQHPPTPTSTAPLLMSGRIKLPYACSTCCCCYRVIHILGIIGIGTVAWEEMIFNTNKITIFYRQFLLLNYQPPIDSRGTGSSFFFLLVCAGYEKCWRSPGCVRLIVRSLLFRRPGWLLHIAVFAVYVAVKSTRECSRDCCLHCGSTRLANVSEWKSFMVWRTVGVCGTRSSP